MRLSLAALALASLASAQISQYCPSGNSKTGPCYSVFIPKTTASSGSGDIFLQITAPTSFTWVAGGMGSQMSGSNVFVVYADSSGNNVTLSPRLPQGHNTPTFAASTQAVLLGGSGIANGMMTANIRCANCQSWKGGSIDVTSSKTSWVWAQKSGSALKSDSQSASISQHDQSDVFTLDLTGATGADTVNPFVALASTSGTASGPAATVQSVGSSASGGSSDRNSTDMIILAHGVLMGLVFLGIYPFAALMMRVLSFRKIALVHGSFQGFGMVLMYVALGLGAYAAHKQGELFNNFHTIFGLVVVLMLLPQPFLGWWHHGNYKKTSGRTVVSFIHMNYGRILIFCGALNGVWGPRLGGNMSGSNTWTVVFAVVALVYLVVFGATAIAKRRRARNLARQDQHNGNAGPYTDSFGKARRPRTQKGEISPPRAMHV